MIKKNILFIISQIGFNGGAEKVCANIENNLSNDFNTNLLTFYDEKNKYQIFGKYFSLKENSSNNFFINFIKLFKRAYQIKKYCKNNNIDTSISFMEEANFPNILSKIIFLNKSKIIISIRHSINEHSVFYKILIFILYRFSNKITVLTQFEKNNLINKYYLKKEKIKIIHNFLNFKKINTLKNEKLESKYKDLFKTNIFTIISIGRLNKVKNFTYLIQEFSIFNKSYPNSQLIILGEGEERKNLKNLIKKLNLEGKVFLLGQQKNIYPFLNKSNLFISTSFNESFSNVIIEAMSLGLPIISYNHQGGKEILGEDNFGILYKKNLSKNIEKVYLSKTLRKDLEKKSLERAKDFNINNIMDNWRKVI